MNLPTEADVICPHCGEPNTIGIDPAGGGVQRYVEDCQVCCRPWNVTVTYNAGGCSVDVEPA